MRLFPTLISLLLITFTFSFSFSWEGNTKPNKLTDKKETTTPKEYELSTYEFFPRERREKGEIYYDSHGIQRVEGADWWGYGNQENWLKAQKAQADDTDEDSIVIPACD